jgi:hypothetical protein
MAFAARLASMAWLGGRVAWFACPFNMSDNDVRIATARRERAVPTLQQIAHVLANMPAKTDIEKRNRALIGFAILTDARDGAMASLKLRHVDLIQGKVFQDGRECIHLEMYVSTTATQNTASRNLRLTQADAEPLDLGHRQCCLGQQ